MQSLIPAVYPILKTTYHLDFGQVGLITLSSQMTASLLQPVVGLYTDKRPMPYSLAIGMGFTLAGLLLISTAPTFAVVLAAVALVGMGSSVFHPESSRVARMASGGQHGLAQSLFQVGGNAGTALGPLLAAYIVLPQGQKSIGWFSVVALVAMAMLARIGAWYKAHRVEHAARASREATTGVPKRQAMIALTVLIALVFSKFFYMVSLNTFYEFYLMANSIWTSAPRRSICSFSWARSPSGPSSAARWVIAWAANASSGGRFWAPFRSRCCCPMPACSGPSA